MDIDKLGRDTKYASEQEKITGARKSFWNARRRCNKKTDKDYPRYGGRGILMLFKSADELIENIGSRPSPLHSLERIRTNGHYEPGNVCWATRKRLARTRLRQRKIETPRLSSQEMELAVRAGQIGAHRRHHVGKGITRPQTCELCRNPHTYPYERYTRQLR